MEIGIFGGTFNPFHNGTLAVARQALMQVPLSKIIFVPNGNPPHKRGILDKELRFELVSAGISGEKQMEVSRLEIDRPGTSWTIDTLIELRKAYPSPNRLNFILGEDNVASLESYERREEFFQLARLLISPRLFPGRSKVQDWQTRLKKAEILVLECQANDISATKIRELAMAGKEFKQFLPEPVYELICRKNIYGPGPRPLAA